MDVLMQVLPIVGTAWGLIAFTGMAMAVSQKVNGMREW